MPWLIAFLIHNAVAITAVGSAAYAVSQLEQVAINTTTLVKEVEKKPN